MKSWLILSLILFANYVCGQNLIQNADCELPLVNGKIPYWTEVLGNRWRIRSIDPTPQHGTNYFFAGVGTETELAQTITLANYANLISQGSVSFRFSGYVRAWPQRPPDQSQIIIEMLDSKGSVVQSEDLGVYDQVVEWKLVDRLLKVTAQTRKLKIRLLSHRKAGSNNDGYFDNLSLIAETSSTAALPQQRSANSGPIDTPKLNEPVVLKNVLFKQSTATLLAQSFSELDRLANLMQTKSTVKIRLEGHTDRIGDAASNLKLSQDRVGEVKRYLIQKGILDTRIMTKGYGDTRTICNPPCEANRRVEFVVTEQ